jgi:EmrB/QacA subfamily drug resistance transporter
MCHSRVATGERQSEPRRPPAWVTARSRLNRPLALLVAGTFFMEILDGTILSTAAPAIATDLGVNPVDVNTAMTSYLIALAAGIPVSGWLTDRFGGRRVLAVAIAVFTVASIACAASTSLPALVAMRIVQGFGGALMVPVGRLVVLRETSKADLLDAIAYLTWPALLAPVIAPTLGGWIVTVASWHWIFLINVPLGAVAFVVTLRVVPTTREPDPPPLDWLGFVLCGGSLAAAMIFLELLQPQGGLDWDAVLMGGVASVLLVLATGWWLRRTPHPILRFDALQVHTFAVSNIGGGLYRLVISAVPFLVPLLLQVGFGFSPVLSGMLLLLLFAGNVAIKPATSPLIRRFGFRRVLIGSIAAGAVIIAALGLLRPTTSLVIIGTLLLVSGVFRSIGFSAYNSLQFADISGSAMAGANTLSATLQQLAGGLGVAIGALLLRIGEQLAPSGAGSYPYAYAFGGLALIMIIPLVQAVRLDPQSGSELAVRR